MTRPAGELGFPIFVKPANLGSSVGISKARNCEELKAALELARAYDRKVIVERGITGREFECAVLGNDNPMASVPCEILPSREFYDYDDKYLLDQAQTVIPANLSPRANRGDAAAGRGMLPGGRVRRHGARGFSARNRDQSLYINEINTIPGFTSISMYPKMWEYSGLPMPKLIDRLIELALERHAAKQRLRYSK